MQSQKRRVGDSQRFTRVNLNVWLIVLVAVAWGIIRHLQGAFDIGWTELLILCALGFFSAAARTWVGLRDPKVMYSFTLPLVVSDILIISLAVYFTGGYQSEAWLLYFALLVSESATMSTPALFAMLGLATGGYALASSPWTPDLAAGFLFRMAIVGLTAWLMHQLLRSHVEYRLELAELREQMALARERERIAQEFHDGLGNTLVSVIMGLEAFCHQMSKQDRLNDTHYSCLKEQIALLRDAIEETRQIIRQLEPSRAPDLRLQIRQMAERTAQRLGARLDFKCPDTLPTLTPLQTLVLLRVVREALTNILKHAQNPTTITVECAVENQAMRVCICDDGAGFAPNQVVGGFGLHHMRERVESLGGEWHLRSAPQQGTAIVFSIPIGGKS